MCIYNIYILYLLYILIGISGRELKSAGIAIYGPRTTVTVAIDNMPYAHEFLLVDDFRLYYRLYIQLHIIL